MKYFILAIAIVCLVLYAGAELTLRHPPRDGVIRMRWATDPNPARDMQTALFKKLYPGHAMSVDPGLGGDTSKLVVQCATGVGPDIIDVYDQNQMDGLVRAGILLDLTPYAAKMGFGTDKTYPALYKGLTVLGRQYRYPCNVWANAIIYNKQVFDDHGVPCPSNDWTWDDFTEVGKRFLAPGKSGKTHIPLASFYNFWVYNDLLVNFGGRWFSDDGLTSQLDSAEAVAAMNYYSDLIYKHHLIPSPSESAALSSQGGWGHGAMHWFSSGRAAMIPIGRWYIVIARNYPDIVPQLAAVRMPHLPGRPSVVMADTRAAGVNVKSPNRKAALKWLQYLAGPDYGNLIVEDGDSLPPNPDLARTGRDLVNKYVTDPAFHQVFIDSIKEARPLDSSPFIDAAICQRLIVEMLGKIENRIVTPEDGMKALANEINQTIRMNLDRRPDLRKTYREVTGRPYRET